MTDIIAAKKRESMRNDLMAAYEAYARREPTSMDNLLTLVRAFAYRKVLHLEHDFKDFGTAETVDDWAQEITMSVWLALKSGQFEGTPAGFYSWVHKIAFNRGTKAFDKLYEEKKARVPLFIKSEEGGDENGDTYEEENPALHEESGSDHSIRIPKSVQGVDLRICQLMLTQVRDAVTGKHRGRNYADIGLVLGMTEEAVKKRMERLRLRLKVEREQEKGGTTNSVAAD